MNPATSKTFHPGETVVGLVPIQLQGYAKPCDVGYHYTVRSSNGDDVLIYRDEVAGIPHYATVKTSELEPAYRIVNGISYHRYATQKVINVLEQCRQSQTRIRIHLGYTEKHKEASDNPSLLGKDWLQELDSEGTISNSMGPTKVPLLIANSRSMGGGALLDDCIVKITTTGKDRRTLYQHPNYHHGKVTVREIGPNEIIGKVNLRTDGYTTAVDIDGENQANFKSPDAAQRYIRKMNLA